MTDATKEAIREILHRTQYSGHGATLLFSPMSTGAIDRALAEIVAAVEKDGNLFVPGEVMEDWP